MLFLMKNFTSHRKGWCTMGPKSTFVQDTKNIKINLRIPKLMQKVEKFSEGYENKNFILRLIPAK